MEKIKSVAAWFGVLLLYLSLNLVFSNVIDNLNIKNNLFLNLVTLGFEILITIILVIIYIKDFKNDIKDIRKNDKEYIFNSIRIWLIGLIIMILSNAIISVIVGNIADNETANRTLLSHYYVYAIPSMIILAPICEEILFRLSLGKVFNNKIIFSIVSGLVFGYMHVVGSHGLEYLYLIPYGALGASFAYLYKKYNNIYCSIIVHMLHNLFCIIILTIL